MRAACFVGRVGGLAVALGIGIAVANTPVVAWADDTPSAPSGESTATAGTAGTNGASETQGTSTTIGTTAKPAGTSTGAVTETNGVSTPGSGSAGISNSGTSASKAASVRRTHRGNGECHRRRAVVEEGEQRHLRMWAVSRPRSTPGARPRRNAKRTRRQSTPRRRPPRVHPWVARRTTGDPWLVHWRPARRGQRGHGESGRDTATLNTRNKCGHRPRCRGA